MQHMPITGFGRGRGRTSDAKKTSLFADIGPPPSLTKIEVVNNLRQTKQSSVCGQFSDEKYDNNGVHKKISVFIPSSAVGKVIGPRGSRIREMTEQTGCDINVDRSNSGEETEVILSGTDEAIDGAKALILKAVGHNNNNSNSNQKAISTGEDREVINIPSNLAGRVIGSGGSRIRELRDESGASIDVGRDSDVNDLVDVVISGNKLNITKAKQLVLAITGRSHLEPSGGNDSKVSSASTFDWDAALADDKRKQEIWLSKLTPIKKDFYIEDPRVANMSDSKVAEIRRHNMDIQVSYNPSDSSSKTIKIPNPILTFEQAFNPNAYGDILKEIRKQGFTDPSPIQKQMWPILLSGHDCIGIAQTGTGKTLAFLLPAFLHIMGQNIPKSERVGPIVFCLAPTRELALQIKWEVNKYNYKGIKSCCVYGGGNRREQIEELKQGIDIVVATPGRLNDLLETRALCLEDCSYLILDEADRMLDMGFEPQIKKTLLDIRPDRHTVMTSATWPPGVRRIANEYMTDSVIVNIGSLDLKAATTITQEIVITTSDDKLSILQEKVETQLDHRKDKCLIFVSRKSTADFLSSEFITRYIQPKYRHLNIKSDAIHGNRDQSDREQALMGFKEGDISILIATDVASRGLDVRKVTHVINYDFPRDMEDYVHRVGRTGRAGRHGTAVTFFTREDWKKSADLIKILRDSDQYVPPELEDMAERWSKKKAQLEREGKLGNRRQRYR